MNLARYFNPVRSSNAMSLRQLRNSGLPTVLRCHWEYIYRERYKYIYIYIITVLYFIIKTVGVSKLEVLFFTFARKSKILYWLVINLTKFLIENISPKLLHFITEFKQYIKCHTYVYMSFVFRDSRPRTSEPMELEKNAHKSVKNGVGI